MQKELLDITEYIHGIRDAVKVYMDMELLKKDLLSVSLLKNPNNDEEAYKLTFKGEGDCFLLFKYDAKTLKFLQKYFKFTKETEK